MTSESMPETRLDRLLDWLRELGPSLGLLGAFASLFWTAIAAYFFSVGSGESAHIGAVWLVAAGFALVITLMARPVPGRDALEIQPGPLAQHRVRSRTLWVPTVAGAVILAIVAEISGNVFDPAQLVDVSHHDQLGLLIGGIGLLAWGLRGPRVRQADDAPKRDWRQIALDSLPIIGVLMIAGLTRFYALDAARVFIDEVHFANPVQHFNDADDLELLLPFSSVAAFPYLYPYLQWMGAETVGYTLAGLRVASAVFGVLGVGAVYLLGRELFDKRVALMAALLLATFPPHMHFSRMGLNNIADPFFGTMALMFIARGLRSHGWRDLRGNFALAGVMLGLTQYFYEGGRLLYPPLVMAWLLALVAIVYAVASVRMVDAPAERPAIIRRIFGADYRNLAVACVALGVGAVVVGAPVYYTLYGRGESALSRLETAGLGGDERFISIDDTDDLTQHIGKQFVWSILLHTSQPESALYYAGETPMVHPVVLPVFLLGVLWCVARLYSHGGASLLVIWIMLTVMGNTLMQDSRIAARYVVSFPAMALAMALGLRVAGQIVLHGRERWLNAALALAVLGLAAFQVNYYFNIHIPTLMTQFRERLVLDSHDVLFRAAELPTETEVYMVSEHRMSGLDAGQYVRFLNRGMTIRTLLPEEFTAEVVTMIDPAADLAFFIDPTDVETLLRLQAFYPVMDGPYYSDDASLPQDQQYALYLVGGG